jgi:hypothetical protein
VCHHLPLLPPPLPLLLIHWRAKMQQHQQQKH